MPYQSIFKTGNIPQPTKTNPLAVGFTPGQYGAVNAKIAATHVSTPKSIPQPKVQAATPPNGPTGFWNRITEVGVGKVNIANIKNEIQHKPTVQSNNSALVGQAKNDVVSAYQHANPFSGVHNANSLISQTQQQFGLTSKFVQILHNANTSTTKGKLATQGAQAITYKPGTASNVVNRTQINVNPQKGAPKGSLNNLGATPSSTLVHEGLHQVWFKSTPQQKQAFGQAYNQAASQDKGLQGYLNAALNVNGKTQLTDFSKMPPALQDEVHSETAAYYLNQQKVSSNSPIDKYYSQYLNLSKGNANYNNAQKIKTNTGQSFLKSAAGGVKNMAVSTAKGVAGAGEDVSNAIGNTEVRIGNKLGLKAKTGTETNVQQFGKKLGALGGTTAKEKIGNLVQAGSLGLGGSGKVVEVTGADLIKKFGTQGVKDLADKAGIDLGGKGSIEGAKEVAQTKVAQQAFKKATTTVVGRAAKSSVKGAAGFGTFSAAQEASAGGSNKQILKAGESGAKFGAVAGAGGSLLKSGVKSVVSNPLKDVTTRVKGEPIKAPSPPSTKLTEKSGSASTPEDEVKTSGQGSVKSTPVSAPVNPKVKLTTPKMNESGGAAPGQAVKDVQDLIAKHQETTKYSGDIQRGGDEVEGAKKQIASDAVKLAKNSPSLNAIDKRTIQDYRDNKEAGLPTKELPVRLQKTNDEITALNKAALSAKQEQAKLEGKEFTDNVNPETYTHREAQGKGSMFDRLVQGTKSKITGGTSFGKRISSDKGRVFQAVTDDSGNRQVVSVKNESFGKVKHLTGFDENQKPVKLGKYSAEGDTLTNAKGKQLKLSQATTSEITKASGQKYYTDPHLTSLKNYVDARTALENVKFIDSIKNHPDFEKFASPPDTTAPKGYEPVHGLFQFMGYKFEPKTAEALRDIVKNSSDETAAADKVGNFLKRTIVYFPLKHNLNQTATYAVDRGLSSLANPAAYYRGAKSLVKAFQEVTNQGPIFQKLQKAGFELPSADEKAFTKYVTNELKGASPDDPRVVEIAKSFGTSPARLYKAIQHTAVWQYGDVLNVARVIERMEPKLLSKGQDFDSAMKQTEKYSLQYKVPSRVGPTKLGRSVSRTLQSPKVFFGRYRYDLYKIMGNTIKDTVNLKTLAKGGKENLQAVDKLAAMAFGAAVVWPLVDKGLQKLSGNPNSYMTAPGALQLPELAGQVATGKKTPEAAAGSQIYPSPVITVPLEVQANRDSFTGKQIYDPNASEKQKMAQVGSWIKGQSSFGEKATAVGRAKGNKAVDTILSIAGTNTPSNSPTTNKLYSLQYDSLPNIQTQAKAQAKQGNFDGAQKTIESYDKQVLTSAVNALKAAKQPVPSDQVLIKKLKASGAYYTPKEKTIRAWQTKKPSNAKNLLGL